MKDPHKPPRQLVVFQGKNDLIIFANEKPGWKLAALFLKVLGWPAGAFTAVFLYKHWW